MTADQLLNRARARVDQIVGDKRRQFITDNAVAGVDPDGFDEWLAAHDAEYAAWLDGVMVKLRAELIKEFGPTVDRATRGE